MSCEHPECDEPDSSRTFVAKESGWYKTGTEAELIVELEEGRLGLFCGIHPKKPHDQEVCGFDEFDITE